MFVSNTEVFHIHGSTIISMVEVSHSIWPYNYCRELGIMPGNLSSGEDVLINNNYLP